MHDAAFEYVRRAARALGPRKTVVEFGGRNVNGSIRSLFRCERYLAIDQFSGEGVDLVADCAIWSPPEEMEIDTVVCCSVLEHAATAREMVLNAASILGPGGAFVCTTVADPWPAHSAIDGGALRPGEFYRSVSDTALWEWLTDREGFDGDVTVERHARTGDVFSVAKKLRRVRKVCP